MKVKKNDTVLILTGKDAGKSGKVLSSDPKAGKVKVDGINVQKKSQKARRANETSQIISQVGAIDASNVMVICPKCGKATRVAHKEIDGKKVRICKKCGASLDSTPEAKKATKQAKAEVSAEAPKKRATRAKKEANA